MPTTTATELAQLGSVVTVNSGNVGIGTSSPNFKFEAVAGTTVGNNTIARFGVIEGALGREASIDFGATFSSGWSGSDYLKRYSGRIAYGSTGGSDPRDLALKFFTANKAAGLDTPTERLRIDSSGNVGVGTNNPSVASGLGLVLNGGASQTRMAFKNTYTGDTSTDGVQFALVAASSQFLFQNRESDGNFAFETNSVERLRIDSSGNVLIGTTNTNPIASRVNGIATGPVGFMTLRGPNVLALGVDSNTGTQIAFYTDNGSAFVPAGGITSTGNATAYNTSSDYRLKTNLEPISNGISRLKQLPVYRFNWISDIDGNKVDGFLAHEAQAIVHECVTGEKDAVDAEGKPIYQGIDQSKIVPLLTAALKEAIAKIETLEAKVTALEVA